MNISQRGINAIKAHEGLRLVAYPDPASGGEPFTVGHGHTQGVKQGQTITAAQAEDFLREDLYWVEQCIRDTVRVPLNQEQYDALCSLIFNIGAGAFSRSTLLRNLNNGDYSNAATEFMKWDMAAGKRMPGLTKRREAEVALFGAGPAQGAPTTPAPIPAQPPAPAAPPAAEVDTSSGRVQEAPKTEHIPAGESGDAPEIQTMAPILIGIAKTFLGGLAAGLIDAYTPLAKEKVTKELERHGADSTAAAQIVGAVVDAAKAATGLSDPAAAVVEAQKDPVIIQKVEEDTLATLDKLAPLLDKIEAQERQAFADSEASRRAAQQHNADDPLMIDFPWLKLKFIHVLSIAFVSFSGWFVTMNWSSLTPELKGAVITLMIIAGWNGVRDYWMGSSRSSSAKDVVIGELSRRKQ